MSRPLDTNDLLTAVFLGIVIAVVLTLAYIGGRALMMLT